MKKQILSAIFILSAILGCKVTSNSDQAEEGIAEDKYTLVVSFYSPGDGIDYENLNKYNDFLEKNYPNVSYEKIPWGKEGEVDYCIALRAMKSAKRKKFIEDSKTILKSSSKINFYENADCRHKVPAN